MVYPFIKILNKLKFPKEKERKPNKSYGSYWVENGVMKSDKMSEKYRGVHTYLNIWMHALTK